MVEEYLNEKIETMRPEELSRIQELQKAQCKRAAQYPYVEPSVKVHMEYTQGTEDLQRLNKEIEDELKGELVFRADVQLVPEPILPRYEMKAEPIKKMYGEE